MELARAAGILLHPTSLPSGKLDRDAYRFVDWLAAAGQSWWQVLPLGPPDEFGSPYRSPSAFAASPQLLARPAARVTAGEVEDFVARHPFWTGGWARFAGMEALADEVRFEREWRALRAYAAERGVRLIGDVPIYVSDGGADHDCWPELFSPGEVAGAPPDALSPTGQRWGNPLYDWPVHRATGFHWWRERFRRTLELVDLTRIDHFRGFVSYWSVPATARHALSGHWKRGPGRAVFDAAAAELGELALIAEDLGVITPAVERLRDGLGYPGMAILQYHFDPDPHSPHNLANHREHQVVYTGTHDHDTLLGWYRSLPGDRRAEVDAQIGPGDGAHWRLIDLAFSSVAVVAMVQTQDVLGLGSEARMNMPGTAKGSWKWRLREGALTGDLARRLRAASEAAGRA